MTLASHLVAALAYLFFNFWKNILELK